MAVTELPSTIVPKRWTTDEFEAMVSRGVISEDARVELIEGVVADMAAIGPRHMACVILLQEAFHDLLGKTVFVSTQNAIRLSGSSVPQPDIALLKRKQGGYLQALPEAADVLLVVEVADSTLEGDRTVKVPMYASAGIPEIWIVNLNEDVIEVFSQPVDGNYAISMVIGRDAMLPLPEGLIGEISVGSIFD